MYASGVLYEMWAKHVFYLGIYGGKILTAFKPVIYLQKQYILCETCLRSFTQQNKGSVLQVQTKTHPERTSPRAKIQERAREEWREGEGDGAVSKANA